MRTEIHGAPEWNQKWQSVDWFVVDPWLLESAKGNGRKQIGWPPRRAERERGGWRGNAPVRVDVAVEREDGGGCLRLHPGDRAGRPAPHGLVPAHRRRCQQQREQRHKHEASGWGPPRSHRGRRTGQAESGSRGTRQTES
jgi:hypothetical protein